MSAPLKPKILLVEPKDNYANLFIDKIRKTGKKVYHCKTDQEAQNYLQFKEKEIPNHNRTSMILYNPRVMSNSSTNLYNLRNKLDQRIPFYSFHNATSQQLSDMRIRDGHISQLYSGNNLENLINNALIESINLKNRSVLIKLGGSSDDLDFEYEDDRAYVEVLEFCAEYFRKNNINLFINTGGGVNASRIKAFYRKYKKDYSKLKEKLPKQIKEALEYNMEKINAVLEKESKIILPEHMSGRIPLFGDILREQTTIEKTTNQTINPSIENYDFTKFFNQNRMFIIGVAPRHIRLAQTDLSKNYIGEINHPEYPNIAMEDSDANTVLWAKLFNIDRILFIKRTDAIYRYDPYKGFSSNKAKWAKVQKRIQNERLDGLSFEDFIEKRYKSTKTKRFRSFSMQGAFEGDYGHFLEDSAAKLAQKFKMKIGVVHIRPEELRFRGKHIVTGEPFNYNRNKKIKNYFDGNDESIVLK